MTRRSIAAFVSALLLACTVAQGQVPESTSPTIVETVPELPAEAANPADLTVANPGAESEPNVAAVELSEEQLREIEGEPIERGPIHEAFADPLQLTPTPNPVHDVPPPPPVTEIPPAKDPTAGDLDWIPGYWSWDKERADYIWISGVWRKAPHGRRWLAGKWIETDGGHRWVPGTWNKVSANADPNIEDAEVLPIPPNSLEEGATSPAPSDDHFWIPGSWQQDDNREYVWRPGFWSRSYENWVWVPDHYAWRPAGCSFVPGYWDYTWGRRGTLYAPCTFARTDLVGNHCYRPSRVLASRHWLVDLWVGPGSYNYYYGNYNDCLHLGYSPWYRHYGIYSRRYDPLYSYYRWRFPSQYGFGLYSYLNRVHHHRPRPVSGISFHAGKDWHRHRGSRTSLYGDVALNSRRYNVPRIGRTSGSIDRLGPRRGNTLVRQRELGRRNGNDSISQPGPGIRTGVSGLLQDRRRSAITRGDVLDRLRSTNSARTPRNGETLRGLGQSRGLGTNRGGANRNRSLDSGSDRPSPDNRSISRARREALAEMLQNSRTRGRTTSLPEELGSDARRANRDPSTSSALSRTNSPPRQRREMTSGRANRGGSTVTRSAPTTQTPGINAARDRARQSANRSNTRTKSSPFPSNFTARDRAKQLRTTPSTSPSPRRAAQPQTSRKTPITIKQPRTTPSPKIRVTPNVRSAPSVRSSPAVRSTPSTRSAPSSRSRLSPRSAIPRASSPRSSINRSRSAISRPSQALRSSSANRSSRSSSSLRGTSNARSRARSSMQRSGRGRDKK